MIHETPQEKAARIVIAHAREHRKPFNTLLANTLKDAEEKIIHLDNRHILSYPDEHGQLRPCTLTQIGDDPIGTTTTLLAMTTFFLLIGQRTGIISANDILDIIDFIKSSSLYEPSIQWPYTKQQIKESVAAS